VGPDRARNEALDCLVMCLTAIESLRLNLDEMSAEAEACEDQSQSQSPQEQAAMRRMAWGVQPVRRDIIYQPAWRSSSVEGESPSQPRRYGVQNRPVSW
jgi:phage terminase large subunit GpA-like protein